MNTTERKAVEVLAVLDMHANGLRDCGNTKGAKLTAAAFANIAKELCEARAAVAEVFAERDRLANIVRSHEKQILRMTGERAKLIKRELVMREALETLNARVLPAAIRYHNIGSGDIEEAQSIVSAALARVQGGQ